MLLFAWAPWPYPFRAVQRWSAGVQYAASVHAEKLKKVLHRAANRDRPAGQTIGKQYFNPRLVPEEVLCSALSLCFR